MYRIITTTRLEKLLRDSEELNRIHRFAIRQHAEMDDFANNGENARPPEGDDWNDLASAIGVWSKETAHG